VNLTGESKNFKMLDFPLNTLQILSLTAFIFSDLNYKVVIFLSQTENTPKHFFLKKKALLTTIIYNRLKGEMELKMRPEQAGFRPSKLCADHINTLRIITEQSIQFCSPLQLVFIDFQQAFDTLKHEAIWKALKEKKVCRTK
jgi:hypothetical protein